jgi:hypothetical protein
MNATKKSKVFFPLSFSKQSPQGTKYRTYKCIFALREFEEPYMLEFPPKSLTNYSPMKALQIRSQQSSEYYLLLRYFMVSSLYGSLRFSLVHQIHLKSESNFS